MADRAKGLRRRCALRWQSVGSEKGTETTGAMRTRPIGVMPRNGR